MRVCGLLRAAGPVFCLSALGVVVEAVTRNGLGAAPAAVVPSAPTLLGLAAPAAVLSDVLDDIPATLVLLTVLGDTPAPGLVLAVLIGVNVGPDLTYACSLATPLWRRVLPVGGTASPVTTPLT